MRVTGDWIAYTFSNVWFKIDGKTIDQWNNSAGDVAYSYDKTFSINGSLLEVFIAPNSTGAGHSLIFTLQ